MDLTINAGKISVKTTHSGYIEIEITGADDDFIEEVSTNASIDQLLAGKTKSEIRTWVIKEHDWVQNLLNEFWQRSSDACPLEANEADAQEREFVEYVNSL